MRRSRHNVGTLLVCTACLAFTPLNAQRPVAEQRSSASTSAATATGDSRPTASSKVMEPPQAGFIQNQGQFNPKVRFQRRASSTTVWLTDSGLVLDLVRSKAAAPNAHAAPPPPRSPATALAEHGAPRESERFAIFQDLVNANMHPAIETGRREPGLYNYFSGSDPQRWVRNARSYSQVTYKNVWSSIDVRFIAADDASLEQEFIVRPGGDPLAVWIAYRGADRLAATPDGSLVIHTGQGDLRESPPRIYQEINGTRVPVEGRFKVKDALAYTFEIGSYDPRYALVIDPTLLYSTYLGGTGHYAYTPNQYGSSIAVDSSGSAYITGLTDATDFPLTPGAIQTVGQAFITKLDPLGKQLVYSTRLAAWGPLGAPPTAIAVSSSGQAYVTGQTGQGLGFPTTPTAFQGDGACGGYPVTVYSGFITVLDSTGGLVYSSCLGYSTQGNAVAVDDAGRAYITGSTGSGFPTTPGAYEPTYPPTPPPYLPANYAAFVTVVDPSQSGAASLVYSTYLGGGDTAWGNAIAVDAYGSVYVTGATTGPNFPVTPGVYQGGYPSAYSDDNAFVAKLDPTVAGSAGLIYSTYLGANSIGHGVAVDSSGSAYVAGTLLYASSAGIFPTTAGALLTCPEAIGYGFFTKFNAAGNNLAYSTCLGSISPAWTGATQVNAITVDPQGNAYLTGATQASDFPVSPDAYQPTNHGGRDAFVIELNSTGLASLYSSYLGGNGDDEGYGIALDPAGDVYVTGFTSSTDFPVSPSPFQPAMKGTGNAFVTKFSLAPSQTLSISSLTPTSGGNTGTVTPQIFGTGFHSGATAKLNCGQSAVTGTNLSVGPRGTILNSTFDLTAVSPGKCDVVVANADGTSVTLSQAFTVQQGGGEDIQVSLTGVVAGNSGNAVVLATVSNLGNNDSSPGLVSMLLDANFTPTSETPPPVLSANLVAWATPSSSAGSSATFTSTASPITVAAGCGYFNLKVQACYYPDPTINLAAADACIVNSSTFKDSCGSGSLGCVLGCALSGSVSNFLKCLGGCLATCAVKVWPVVNSCLKDNTSPGQPICDYKIVPCVEPHDPNSLQGPSGAAVQRWVAGQQALTYVVSFSNEPNAQVPAQQVVVTQPLGANVNLSTVNLPFVTLPNGSSNIQVTIPPCSFNPAAGIDEYTANVDLRPTQSLFVTVDAKLDRTASTLTWTLTSIDPTTGLPPFNPLVGFLPAGAAANVAFSVMPTATLATGSQIVDQATVVFDGQTPTNTPTWTNTIDNTPPTSHVTSFSGPYGCLDFRVRWSGTDVGSGIQNFTIYVSDTGGPFTPWLTNTPVGSATYQGQAGHSYGFYSIARDRVGNSEAGKTAAEATIQVVSKCSGPPSLTGTATEQSISGNAVTIALQITNNGSIPANNVAITKVTPRVLAGAGKVGYTSPPLPISVGSIAPGASTTVSFVLNIPKSVTQFAIAEAGSVQDGQGKTYGFTIGQELSR